MSTFTVPVGISSRHLHVSQADLETLFGKGATLTVKKDLSQKGQYAAEQTVVISGPKGSFSKVRILGPCRKRTQVEVSRTDCFALGIDAPVRDSGDLEGSATLKIQGPAGEIEIPAGAIVAKRHIHMTPEEAAQLGVKDRDTVMVKTAGDRALVFDEVLARVDPTFTWEMHIDTDEANAASLKNGDLVTIILKD
ncbi:MAG: Phosphate propanoyltransferase [Firmicutes bacterium ADurb.Bin506]|jgi:propanediol utilization protein|nr:MAG: Phosphate propanoyltransferase [Firmicutes bacterium ADurb.Bin506]